MAGKPRVAIIGKGNMGSAFAEGLSARGYPAAKAGRDPGELAAAIGPADIVIVAVPYVALPELIPRVSQSLRGKIVVDISNLLGPNFTFLGELTRSGAEKLRDAVPGSRVVKAFNTVFSDYIVGGRLNQEVLTAFVASDDADAKATVLAMAQDLGLDGVDAGPLESARWLEVMGFYNVAIHATVGWNHGLRLVRG
jgi:predicted dinucleotide-binding enzyme